MLAWLYLAPLVALPLWAGLRVARVGGARILCALGGASVLLGALVAATLTEPFESSPFDSSFLFSLLGIVFMSPLYALFGFLAGECRRLRAHRASV